MASDPRCFVYPALFRSWVDGDTARITLDLGLRTRWEGNARIIGINCPEIRDPGGYEALKFAEQLVPPRHHPALPERGHGLLRPAPAGR